MESAEHLSNSSQAKHAAVPGRSGNTKSEHTVDVLERVGLYRQRRGLESLRVEELEAVAADLAIYGRDPVSYVCNLFKKHQVVFLGHHIPTLCTGLFLQELVRALPSHGVHHVGMEYLCRDDQQLLDAAIGVNAVKGGALITAGGDSFAEGLAREAMLRWGLRHDFAFKEYLDVLKAAWELNSPASPDGSASSKNMRVLGLDYDLDFDSVTETAELRTDAPWIHLRHRGTAARHMCDVLLSEVLDQGHKALVLCRTPHALTRLRRRRHRRWDAFDTEVEAGRVVGAANHVYAAVADRAVTVLIHQPLPADGVLCDYALPADGVLDAVFAMIGAPPLPLGFDTDVGDIGKLRSLTALDDGPLVDLAQGWLYLEPEQQRVAPTPLYGAVPDYVLARARRLALDGKLRRTDVTPADFDDAFRTAAIAAELSWTQIL